MRRGLLALRGASDLGWVGLWYGMASIAFGLGSKEKAWLGHGLHIVLENRGNLFVQTLLTVSFSGARHEGRGEQEYQKPIYRGFDKARYSNMAV